MLSRLSRGLLAGALATAAACGSARVIQRSPNDLVIELQGDHNKAMEQANQEVAAYCGPSNFTLVREGEESIDPAPPASGTGGSGRSVATGSAGSPDGPDAMAQNPGAAIAWRLHYECGGDPVGVAPRPPDPDHGDDARPPRP